MLLEKCPCLADRVVLASCFGLWLYFYVYIHYLEEISCFFCIYDMFLFSFCFKDVLSFDFDNWIVTDKCLNIYILLALYSLDLFFREFRCVHHSLDSEKTTYYCRLHFFPCIICQIDVCSVTHSCQDVKSEWAFVIFMKIEPLNSNFSSVLHASMMRPLLGLIHLFTSWKHWINLTICCNSNSIHQLCVNIRLISFRRTIDITNLISAGPFVYTTSACWFWVRFSFSKST